VVVIPIAILLLLLLLLYSSIELHWNIRLVNKNKPYIESNIQY